MSSASLDAVYQVQVVDSEIDLLVHRRQALPQRSELDAVLRAGKAAHAALSELRAQRDQLTRAVKALDDETQTIAAKANTVNDKLYSGTVTSPRELQDLQTELDSLRRHQGDLEERELEQMVAAEELEVAVVAAEAELAAKGQRVEALRAEIASSEAEIDARHAEVAASRAGFVAAAPTEMVADYERRRAQNNGVGAALLIGDTCQGCRLSVPATEVDEIRHDDSGRVFACDNCGAILVPR